MEAPYVWLRRFSGHVYKRPAMLLLERPSAFDR
jgi:hypothetical protein